MKKILIFCCLFIFVCVLTSGGVIDETDTVNKTDNTSELETYNDDDLIIDGPPLLTMSSYEEYVSFIKSTKSTNVLPDDFVSFENLSRFGKLRSLVFISDKDDYSWYLYSLVDEYGYDIGIYVDHKNRERFARDAISEKDINPYDKRTTTALYGKYNENGIDYSYHKGILYSIDWEINNIQFTLCVGKEIKDYPIDSDTAMSKMLNVDTVGDVIEEIATYEELRAEKKTTCIIMGVVCVLLIFANCCVYSIIKKKSCKRNEKEVFEKNERV